MKPFLIISDTGMSGERIDDLRHAHAEISRLLAAITEQIMQHEQNIAPIQIDEDRLALMRWADDGGYCPD